MDAILFQTIWNLDFFIPVFEWWDLKSCLQPLFGIQVEVEAWFEVNIIHKQGEQIMRSIGPSHLCFRTSTMSLINFETNSINFFFAGIFHRPVLNVVFRADSINLIFSRTFYKSELRSGWRLGHRNARLRNFWRQKSILWWRVEEETSWHKNLQVLFFLRHFLPFYMDAISAR